MPSLDVPTLMFAGGLVSVLCAAALCFVWWQHHFTSAALWWSASSLTLGAAIVLLATGFVVGMPATFMVGLMLLIVSAGLSWAGMRAFHDRRNRPLVLVGGPLAWVLFSLAIGPNLIWASTVANTLLLIAYYGAAISELLRNGREKSRARTPLIAFLVIHIATLLLAIPAALNGNLRGFAPPPIASLFGLIHIETIVFVVATTFLLIAMKRERSEQRLLHEAQTDALTGLANRRAFLPLAERAAERCRRRGEPLAVAVFDLDCFKLINDTYGHASGDEVLRVFAKVAREALRPGDIVSRVGGEEFFAILPGANQEDGCATAERVRSAFEDARTEVNGYEVRATVSAGVMASADGDEPLATLLEKADAALYRAKLRGRNCVCGLDEPQGRERAYPRLVRVA